MIPEEYSDRVRTDCKPRANNRHLKRKIEYPVLRYGWTDHGGRSISMAWEDTDEREKILLSFVLSGIDGNRHGCLARAFLPRNRRGHETAGRCLHQADQDDHRSDHLLYRCNRYR